MPFQPVYTARKPHRLNKRQTVLKMAREMIFDFGWKTFTAWDISEAIKTSTGGEVDIAPSLCDLVLMKYYNKLENSKSFVAN